MTYELWAYLDKLFTVYIGGIIGICMFVIALQNRRGTVWTPQAILGVSFSILLWPLVFTFIIMRTSKKANR